MQYHKMTRLFAPILTQNDNIEITNSLDLNYLSKVMRKKTGNNLLVFNKNDGEFLAQIIEISNKKITLKLLEKIGNYKQEPELNLIFAPIKQNRINFLLEKSTELGVTKLVPIITKHCVVDKINLDKWYIYVKEAAEQCGRLSIPEILPLQSLSKFLDNWNKNDNIIFCNEQEKTLSFAQHLENTTLRTTNILIGPEGGFSADEITLLTSKTFITSVHLGTRILRTETACLAALALAENKNM